MSKFITCIKTIEYELRNQKKPLLREWYMYSLYDDYHQRSECEGMLSALCSFTGKKYIEEIDFPGIAYLCGKVYGRKGFIDGSEIATSQIVKLRKVNIPEEFKSLEDAEQIAEVLKDNEYELYCGITKSGSEYYLLKWQMADRMSMFMNDYLNDGTVNWRLSGRHYYG